MKKKKPNRSDATTKPKPLDDNEPELMVKAMYPDSVEREKFLEKIRESFTFLKDKNPE